MPLLNPNNPNTDIVLMTTLKEILLPNTYLAQISTSGTGSELCFIQEKYKMALNMTEAIPYAVNLSSGEQRYERVSHGTFEGIITINVEYYSRWNDQNSTIDDIWKAIAEDLERMKSNVETNDTLEYGGENHAISIAEMTLDPYQGMYDQTFTGFTLVSRSMHIAYNILPYDV